MRRSCAQWRKGNARYALNENALPTLYALNENALPTLDALNENALPTLDAPIMRTMSELSLLTICLVAAGRREVGQASV